MQTVSHDATGHISLLIVATTVPVSLGDGTPSFVLDLAIALASRMNVTILAPRVRGTQRYTEVSGVEIERFPYFPRRWEGLADDAIMPTLKAHPWRWIEVAPLVLSMAWQTWRMTRRDRFHVINSHWIVPAGLIASVVSPARGIPYIVTIHGADAYTLNGKLARFAKSNILRHAHSSLPVSSDIARIADEISHGKAEIREPTPMGVPTLEAIEGQRSESTFLFVGRLAEKKGLHVALEALARSPRSSLRIIGEGPELRRLESLASELDLDTRVTFLGRRSRHYVLSEMRTCAAVLIPSVVASDGDTDGTPVVLAEAMSCGTPVIASRIAGLADYIKEGETGLLVEPGNIDELATTLNSANADRLFLAEIGTRAESWFRGSPLDVTRTAEDYATALTEALAQQHA